MSQWHRGWAILVAFATTAELLNLQKPERTLSAATRAVCRTHTPVGKAVFISGWLLLTVWFVPHIVTDPKDST